MKSYNKKLRKLMAKLHSKDIKEVKCLVKVYDQY